MASLPLARLAYCLFCVSPRRSTARKLRSELNDRLVVTRSSRTEETVMRAIVVATIFLLSSFSSPSQAQQNEQSPPPQNQSEIPPAQSPPATVPVQPERTPQQAQQSRKEDRDRAEDVRIRPGWRAAEHDSDNSMGRMMARTGRMDRDDMAR